MEVANLGTRRCNTEELGMKFQIHGDSDEHARQADLTENHLRSHQHNYVLSGDKTTNKEIFIIAFINFSNSHFIQLLGMKRKHEIQGKLIK